MTLLMGLGICFGVTAILSAVLFYMAVIVGKRSEPPPPPTLEDDGEWL